MKRNKGEIVSKALQNKANGISYEETCREYGISSQSLRNWMKDENVTTIETLCEERGVDIRSVSGGWVKGKEFSLRFKDSQYHNERLLDKILKGFKVDEINSDIELGDSRKIGVIGMSDLHIGKPGTDTSKYFNSFTNIVDKMQVDKVERIILLMGNDALNVDNVLNTTVRGTPQEVEESLDISIHKLYSLYKGMVSYIIKKNIRPMILYSVGNHDASLSLAVTIGVSIDYPTVQAIVNLDERKYVRFGKCLIGFKHGDKGNDEQLPSIMSVERAQDWGSTNYRYFLRGDKHHLTMKDFRGCTVIGMRSLSGTDKWHSDMGFIGSPRATEGFVFDFNKGMVAQYFESI